MGRVAGDADATGCAATAVAASGGHCQRVLYTTVSDYRRIAQLERQDWSDDVAAVAYRWADSALDQHEVAAADWMRAENGEAAIQARTSSALTRVVGHALRWGIWAPVHADAALMLAEHSGAEFSVNSRASTTAGDTERHGARRVALICAGVELGVIRDTTSSHPFQQVLDAVPGDVVKQAYVKMSNRIDALNAHEVGQPLPGGMWAGMMLRLAEHPLAVFTDLQRINQDVFVDSSAAITEALDHPHTGAVIDEVDVSRLRGRVQQVRVAGFEHVCQQIAGPVWEVVVALWPTWVGTWGDLVAAAEQIAGRPAGPSERGVRVV